jgi:hypothetical protein
MKDNGDYIYMILCSYFVFSKIPKQNFLCGFKHLLAIFPISCDCALREELG